MAKKITLKDLSNEPGCLAEYDPNAMQIESVKKLINSFIKPIKEAEYTKLIDSLNRVLAVDLVSPINVPNYDNSAMDGFGFNISSLKNKHSFLVTCSVTSFGKTGVEMEALTGVSVACLTVYDMCKSIDKGILIKEIKLIKKKGGKSDFVDS